MVWPIIYLTTLPVLHGFVRVTPIARSQHGAPDLDYAARRGERAMRLSMSQTRMATFAGALVAAAVTAYPRSGFA
jgi:hypothetical protein